MAIQINGTSGISGVDGSAATPALQGTDTNSGISFPAADTVAINTGGSERVRTDSSGRLLVGTSSTSVTSTLVLQGNSVAASAQANLNISCGTTTPVNGQALGLIAFGDGNQATGVQINARADATGWTSGTSQPGRIEFLTTADGASSPTERMRITSDGYIYIVDAEPYSAGYGGGSSGGFRWRATTTQAATQMEGYSANTATSRHMLFSNPNGVVGSITTTTSSTAYNTSSDYRLKENVVAVTDGINRLQQLKPSRFNFIADPNTVVDGFIAHEVQGVVPEAVTGTKDEVDDDGNPVYQGIDQSKLVPLLTAALQEAIGEIESLKARVAALEAA